MQTRTRNPFTTIHTEGALLPSDLLQRVLENDKNLTGLSPDGYHLSGEKLNEAINRSWNRLQGAWAAFRASRSRLGVGDAGTTLTRERWLLPLFDELDYGRLQTAKAVEIEGKSYPISHGWANVPIHLVGCGVDLERRSAGVAGASKASPHSLMQEFLNRSPEAQWGLVSNGLRLRVLRDNAALTRQAFLEFDLEAMFEGEVYSDFALLWLVCHQSRFETVGADGVRPDCILEQWSKTAQEQGTRALEQLRKGVEQAIAALGSGFLRAPANQKLRADLRSGALSTQDYYRQLLRLVYRLIFLFVAEDRDLLFDPQSSPEARGRYLRHYALGRLRRLAERSRGGRHPDLYAALRLVTDILGGRDLTPGPSPAGRGENVGLAGLGLPVLGGFLFAGAALPDLESAELENESLLSAIRHLTLMEDGRNRRAVDYKNLGARELGSVYESLLELHPLMNADAATFELNAVAGSERKTTGSFYTPEELIAVLLDSALEPVIEQALNHATGDGGRETDISGRRSSVTGPLSQEKALLNLKICDPACGSGHFLLAAARRMARRLAQVRTGESEPAPEMLRAALREVISQCIYGVDLNPMSVELCKVSLWMEALEPGKPLSFLDAHIQCGDSLVGVAPGLDISEIPDEAFNPAFGDDKATASALKKRNKAERGGQMGLDVFVIRDQEDLAAWMARQAQEMDALPEETAEQVGQKAQTYREYLDSPQYRRRKQEYDLWTAAFFWKMEAQPGSAGILAPTQEMLRRLRSGGTLPPELLRRVEELARRLNFLHWELAFPKVFAGDNPGFDCVLGNPPWETLQLEEQEFFATRDPQIASLPGDLRKKAIIELVKSNPVLAGAFEDAKHKSDANNKFLRMSNRFGLSATGKLNTYALFAEHFRNLLSVEGFGGIILPTGIATDDSTKQFFGDLLQKQSLVRITGFENESLIFQAVHHSFKFCALTMVGLGRQIKSPEFVFFCRRFEDIRSPQRIFTLTTSDFSLINPNSGTTPIFRTKTDADLNRKIYQKVAVLMNEYTAQNNWQIRLKQGLFNMTTDSNLFQTEKRNDDLPLYEAKMIDHYDHRYGTYEGATQAHLNLGNLPQTTELQKQNPAFLIIPRYWVTSNSVMERLQGWNHKWLIGFRDVTSSISERTSVFSLLPIAGVGHTMPLVFFQEGFDVKLTACFLANMNTFVFDYLARQKVSGLHLTFTVFRQLPVLPPSAYTPADIAYIAPRVLELVYTANDLRPFAEDMGYPGEPFRWDEDRRAQLRAELDAYYAHLYGLTRDELRYILDPKEVHGEDFPGETFRVLKEKEIRLYGEYRTRRLVLEAWDGLDTFSETRTEGKTKASISVESSTAHVSKGEERRGDIETLEKTVKSINLSAPAVLPESQAINAGPSTPLSPVDYSLYKCSGCGQMILGFDKEKHIQAVHKGQESGWIKLG